MACTQGWSLGDEKLQSRMRRRRQHAEHSPADGAHPLITPIGRSSATRAASPARSTTATTRSTSL